MVEYITVQEAAEKWGYSESTIRKWCKEGVLSVECKAEKKRDVGRFLKMHNALKKTKERKSNGTY